MLLHDPSPSLASQLSVPTLIMKGLNSLLACAYDAAVGLEEPNVCAGAVQLEHALITGHLVEQG